MKRNETRELIIDTASDLFYKKGYNLTGINEIIAEAGIAKATLYSHFRSKEDLCIAYLEARDETLIENISKFCADKAKGNDQLIAVIEFLILFFKDKDFNGCWCIRTIAEVPKDNHKVRDKIKENKNLLLNFIHQLVAENKPGLAEEAQQKLARRIYLLYESAVTESHLQTDSWPIHESIDLLKSILKG